LPANLDVIDQNVFLANNGLEAVMLASRMRASLVILDIRMPELDGLRANPAVGQLCGHANRDADLQRTGLGPGRRATTPA
jgi:CheY-like chemotaxis protein